MKTQNETPNANNNVFDHNLSSVSDATGIDGKDIIERKKSLAREILKEMKDSNKVTFRNSVICEKVMTTFTHKELAVLYSIDVKDDVSKIAMLDDLKDMVMKMFGGDE